MKSIQNKFVTMDIRISYNLFLILIIQLLTQNVVECDSSDGSSTSDSQPLHYATITESQIKMHNRNSRQTYQEIVPIHSMTDHLHHHFRHDNDEYIGRNGTDNRKPAFYGCKDYAPKVKEEQSPSTFVIQVHAEDPDEYDKITYRVEKSATERAKFRINDKTGEIYTTYTFDRDEPIREKEVCFLNFFISFIFCFFVLWIS